MPSAAEARSLYRAFLREGAKFPNYNVREYVKRRAKEGFLEARNSQAPSVLEQFWKQGMQEMEVVKRQAVVYSLYARRHKSVMDLPTEESSVSATP